MKNLSNSTINQAIVADNIFDLIGNTPVIRIRHSDSQVQLFAKLEGQNIGGSVKDRAAYSMITEAEKRGELTKEKEIIEATSGNTGIALAMIAAVKGYKITIVMSEAMSNERKTMIKLYGANLLLTPGDQGTAGAISKVHEMLKAEPHKYWHANQHDNEDNALMHYRTTAAEILTQVPDVTHVFAGIGTFGTLRGISRRLKESIPSVKVIGVEPILGKPIQGLRNMNEANRPKLYDEAFLDAKINVEALGVKEQIYNLAKTTGVFVGYSSAAIYQGTLNYFASHKPDKDQKIKAVMIFPDKGEKYLSLL